MDIIPQDDTNKPISDDQELAQALAGVSPDQPDPIDVANGMQFEETVPAKPIMPAAPTKPVVPVAPAPEPIISDPIANNSNEITIPDVPQVDVTPVQPESPADPTSLEPTPSEPITPVLPDLDKSIISDGTDSTTAEDGRKDSGNLDDIKSKALNEIRPLIDKANLPPEEKFDTYLLLIRSTDDTSLIEPAHNAALEITDEKRKAEALLDVIKEIDYLSRKDQA